MEPQKVEATAFHGLTETELVKQIRINATFLFPHLCHSSQNTRSDPETIFDIIITNTPTSGKIQAKLIFTSKGLTSVLAECTPQTNVLKAFMALLCTLAEVLGQREKSLLEPIQTKYTVSWGNVDKDEVQAGEFGVSSERYNRQQSRMQRLLLERGGRARSVDSVKRLC